jgi:hypothetical protein
VNLFRNGASHISTLSALFNLKTIKGSQWLPLIVFRVAYALIELRRLTAVRLAHQKNKDFGRA